VSRQPIALGSSQSRSKPLNAARLINFYSEPAPRNSRAPAYDAGVMQGPVNGPFYGTPGQKAFVDSLGASIRCGRFALNYLYVLSGRSLYRIAQNGTATLCTGDTIDAQGYAMMTDNGIQLTLLTNSISFVVVGTLISKITSAAYPAQGVSSIDTIDGYTVFATNDPGSPVFASPTTITNVTNADPAVVTDVAHGYSDGDQVLITGVGGMTQINGREFTILLVDADNYQLVGIDSTSYSGYTFGGIAQKITAQAGGQWFISALYDSASIDPLQFAAAESNPDALVRVIVNNRDVLLFGKKTIEPWQDVGSFPFPFQRVTGALIQKGCLAPLSPALLNTSVFWLGDDHIVYKMDGYTPVRVSDFSQEEIIRSAPVASDAIGMTYSQNGHNFYVLTLPTAGYTLCFDDTTKRWHERRSGTSLDPVVWNVTCIMTGWDDVYVGTSGGAVAQLDLDTATELGEPIRSAAVTPPFYNGLRATSNTVELEMELGVGLPSGQGSDPQVMVRWSNDGTGSWSNIRIADIGRTGNRIDRAIVRRMGQYRQRSFEFSISDPVRRCFYGIRIEGTQATS